MAQIAHEITDEEVDAYIKKLSGEPNFNSNVEFTIRRRLSEKSLVAAGIAMNAMLLWHDMNACKDGYSDELIIGCKEFTDTFDEFDAIDAWKGILPDALHTEVLKFIAPIRAEAEKDKQEREFASLVSALNELKTAQK